MILITGGKYQGKSAFARKHYAGRKIFLNYEDKIAKWLRPAEVEDSSENKASSVLQMVEADLEAYPDCVVVLSEIGCGVTPMEADDRKLRDAAGEAGCYLARRAKEVYRITAGLALRLK